MNNKWISLLIDLLPLVIAIFLVSAFICAVENVVVAVGCLSIVVALVYIWLNIEYGK